MGLKAGELILENVPCMGSKSLKMFKKICVCVFSGYKRKDLKWRLNEKTDGGQGGKK